MVTTSMVVKTNNYASGLVSETGYSNTNRGDFSDLPGYMSELLRNIKHTGLFILNEQTCKSEEVNELVNCTDEELLEFIVNKDHSAFSELVRRYSSKFYSTAYRILMNRTDAEDMVQEAFLKIWNEPGLWDSKYNAKFTTWFYRVIINQCLDYRRKKSYRNHDEYRESASTQFDTDNIIESKSKNDLINSCIKELPERQQIAINLYYYDNLSIAEAAEIMDLKPKGMESLVLRAKENLKSRLREYHEEEAI